MRREGLSAQRIRSWKTSNDPHFDSKKSIRRLYRECPRAAAVVCFDEWGPLQLRPTDGVAWAPTRWPHRMCAIYHRPQGNVFGFYDVHADCLEGIFRERKRVMEISEASRRLRSFYPRRKLFAVLDNLRNVHDHPTFLSLLHRLRIHPLWTPTESR